MKTTYFSKSILIASLGCVMAFSVACGDDDDSSPAPTGGTKATGGSGGSSNNMAGESGGGKTSTAGKTGTGGKSNPTEGGAGAGPVANEGGMGGEAACTDEEDMGCYKCKPSTHEQFLNQCPTTGCEPFDNTKLTSIKNGKLPALP